MDTTLSSALFPCLPASLPSVSHLEGDHPGGALVGGRPIHFGEHLHATTPPPDSDIKAHTHTRTRACIRMRSSDANMRRELEVRWQEGSGT